MRAKKSIFCKIYVFFHYRVFRLVSIKQIVQSKLQKHGYIILNTFFGQLRNYIIQPDTFFKNAVYERGYLRSRMCRSIIQSSVKHYRRVCFIQENFFKDVIRRSFCNKIFHEKHSPQTILLPLRKST